MKAFGGTLTRAAARALKARIDAATPPRKSENVGEAIRHLVPDVYTPGALGWTASECLIVRRPGTTDVYAVLTTDLGLDVVDGKDPDGKGPISRATAVELRPADWHIGAGHFLDLEMVEALEARGEPLPRRMAA